MMLNQLVSRTMMALADPRRRALLRVVAIALALLAGWFVPQHYAFAQGALIPGGAGV